MSFVSHRAASFALAWAVVMTGASSARGAESEPRFVGAMGVTLVSSLFDGTGLTDIWTAEALSDEVRPLHVTTEYRLSGLSEALFATLRVSLGYTSSASAPISGTASKEVEGQELYAESSRTWQWGLHGGLRFCFVCTPGWRFSTYGLLGFDRRIHTESEETESDGSSYYDAEGNLVDGRRGRTTTARNALTQSVAATVGFMAERPLGAGFAFRVWLDTLSLRYSLNGDSSDLTDEEASARLGERLQFGTALNLLGELAYAF